MKLASLDSDHGCNMVQHSSIYGRGTLRFVTWQLLPSAAPGSSRGLALARVPAPQHTFCKGPRLRKILRKTKPPTHRTHRINTSHNKPPRTEHIGCIRDTVAVSTVQQFCKNFENKINKKETELVQHFTLCWC
jgi:hypothetical protein